ncbi:hypothetical protein DSECCO2_501040 [anaerobic digester metagenome]
MLPASGLALGALQFRDVQERAHGSGHGPQKIPQRGRVAENGADFAIIEDEVHLLADHDLAPGGALHRQLVQPQFPSPGRGPVGDALDGLADVGPGRHAQNPVTGLVADDGPGLGVTGDPHGGRRLFHDGLEFRGPPFRFHAGQVQFLGPFGHEGFELFVVQPQHLLRGFQLADVRVGHDHAFHVTPDAVVREDSLEEVASVRVP